MKALNVKAVEDSAGVKLLFYKRQYIVEFMEAVDKIHDLLMADEEYARDNNQELMTAKELWSQFRPVVNDFHSWTYSQLMAFPAEKWIFNPKMDSRVYDELEYHLKHNADCYHSEVAVRERKGLETSQAKRKATRIDNISTEIWEEISRMVVRC